MADPTLVVRVAANLTELKQNLAQGIDQIETTRSALTRMSSAYDGSKTIAQANATAAAIEQIGGVSGLTSAEQAKVNATVQAALDKYAALGKEAPSALVQLAKATEQLEPPLTLADRAAGLLKSTFAQFTLANIVANQLQGVVTSLEGFIATGAKLPAVEASFSRLTDGMGVDAQSMLSLMRDATQNLVSDYDLMLSANKAMLLGLPVTSDAMGDLAKTAITLGRAIGEDATQSLNYLITALGRSSPMILDNLGLTVKVGDANDAYALKLGKTADQLTDAEKKTAFYEAAMEAARAKTAELGEQTKTLGEIADSVWTQIGNVVSHAAEDVNTGVGAVLSSEKQFAQFLDDAMQHGVSWAITMASMRQSALNMAGAQGQANQAAAAAVDPLVAYQEHLGTLSGAMAQLSGVQRAVIIEGSQMGESAAQIAKALGLDETAVQSVISAEKSHAETIKTLAAATAELNTAGQGWRGTLDTIDGSVVEAIKFYLAAGVAQDTLSTAYGLTATQVRAVSAALTDEQEQQKRAADQAAALDDYLFSHSIEAAQAAVDRAQAIFEAATTSTYHFSQDAIQHFREMRDRALDNFHDIQSGAEGIGHAFDRDAVAARAFAAATDVLASALGADLVQAGKTITFVFSSASAAMDGFNAGLDESRIKVRRLDGELETLNQAVARFNMGNSTTYDLSTDAGVEAFRKANPGSTITWSDKQIEDFVKNGGTLQDLIRIGVINLYGAYTSGGGSLPSFAEGVDNFSGGMALVGENGPEIINLPRGSSVYPNGTMPGGGTQLVVNVTVNGSVLADKDALARAIGDAVMYSQRGRRILPVGI